MLLSRTPVGIATALLLALAPSLAAQTREPSRPAAASTASRSPRGPLPDPLLLDGSALEAEKRPEHGMLGEFEMAGDENSKSDKVGQTSEQAAGGGGGQQQQQAGGQQGGAQAGASGGGAAGQPSDQSPQSAGGGAAGSQSQQKAGGAAGSKSAAQGSSGAAEGTQVGQLSGDGSGAQGGQPPQNSGKPQQVALGDSAMQIKPQGGNAPGVVGAERAQAVGKEVPQQYDARTPGGGQQSGAGRGNQGVEKGRPMPTGL